MSTKDKTTLDEVFAFREWMYAKSRSIIEKKGHDYNRTQQLEGDTLFNLRVCSLLGIVDTTEQGILVRLSDKFMRLASLTAPHVEPANKDESVMDTIADIHNYVDYLGLIWHQRQERERDQMSLTESELRKQAMDARARSEPTNPVDICDDSRGIGFTTRRDGRTPLRERTDRHERRPPVHDEGNPDGHP